MVEAGSNNYLLNTLNELKKNGMNEDLYCKIAEEFSTFANLPTGYVLEVLSYFVSYKKKKLYVNEIRNYLKDHSKELFNEYGNRFINSPGCFQVFGIQQENTIIPSFKEEAKIEVKDPKMYNDQNRKPRKNNSVKKAAKKASADKFKMNIQRRKDKEREKDEIYRLIRKQDL